MIENFCKNGSMPPPGHHYWLNTNGIQRKAYKILFDHRFQPNSLVALKIVMMRRIIGLFPSFDVDFSRDTHLDSAIEILSKIAMPVRAKVLKTWLNGWITTNRMHPDVPLCCLFGCHGQPDALLHYVVCPKVYTMVKLMTPDSSESPLVRLGLCHPCEFNLHVQACIFSGYHAAVNQAAAFTTFHENLTTCAFNSRVFVEAFLAEAGNLHLQTAVGPIRMHLESLFAAETSQLLSLEDAATGDDLIAAAAPSANFLSDASLHPNTPQT